MALSAPPDLPEMRLVRGLMREEWILLRDRADQRVTAAQARLEEARARLARRETPTASLDVARAQRHLDREEAGRLGLRLVRRTGARRDELLRLSLDRMEWLPDEGCGIILEGKAAPRRRDEILAGTPPQKRLRVVYLPPPDAALARAWLRAHSPTGALPSHGPFWNAGGPRPLLSDDALERYVHELALDAGVQAYAAPAPLRHDLARGPLGGRARRSHRFFVTLHTIREFAERDAIPRAGPTIAARVIGHSPAVQESNYLLAGLDEARTFAAAHTD